MNTHPSPFTHTHYTREGVPLRASLITIAIAIGLAGSVLAMFAVVLGVAH